MLLKRQCIYVAVFTLGINLGGLTVRAQQEIGFVEKFALSQDRREALAELIPDTHEFFYFHCLHYQNEKLLAEADAMLARWRAKFGDTPEVQNMLARQVLLNYDANPKQALEYLRSNLSLDLYRAPPSRDRAAALATEIDNSSFELQKLIEASMADDRSLNQIETSGLPLLLDRKLAPEQLRALLARLPRADLPRVVERIAEELALKDSRGFGWSNVHAMLTLQQLDELLRLRNTLIEDDNFVRAYATRLAPPEGQSLTDPVELRAYLDRMLAWVRKLPSSQNSFKALVLGNRLRLDLSENKLDRQIFLEYIALPRSAAYYDLRRFNNQRVVMADLAYAMNPQVPLPAMGEDSDLVRRYLEHFFRGDANVNSFSGQLDRNYLEQVFAETKILYGVGDMATWYAKLSPKDQQALRERVEIRFAAHNPSHFDSDAPVKLDVELKNSDELLVKIYEINSAGYLRGNNQPINTAVDLDGLVPNSQRTLRFSQPAHLRHAETLELPELQGRGVWIVDLLGSGQRSRALIQKGTLVFSERSGDAGHVFEIFDETQTHVPSAHIEFEGRKYAHENGKIIVPFAEETKTRNILLVDGKYASRGTFSHRSEAYELQAGFLLDRQSLVSGTRAAVAIRLRLTCNAAPINIQLLQKPRLTIVATDADGIATSQSIDHLDLSDGDELIHTFLVPQRLRNLSFSVSGTVENRSRDRHDAVTANYSVACNAIADTAQIADFFLRQLPDGYQLLVLGRNGEAISRLPISLLIKPKHFKTQQNVVAATDGQGRVKLGKLEGIASFAANAQGLQTASFELEKFHRTWPSTSHLALGQPLELPLGTATASREDFSLLEIRRGVQQSDWQNKIKIENGSLVVSGLSAGDFLLSDHSGGQTVRIIVADGKAAGHFVIGKNRILQVDRRVPLVIRSVASKDGAILIQLDGADAETRVHLIADVFSPETNSARQLQLPQLPLVRNQRISPASLYVNSLRLDEEYRYILDRQGSKTYPGNLLPQPTVLIHPWEVSETENASKQAAAGDPMPAMAAPESRLSEMSAEAEGRYAGARPDWKSFDFLAGGAAIAANLGVENGQVRIPLEQFQGYSSFTVVAVHPTATDTRQVLMATDAVPVRDQRLRSAFEAKQSLAQTRRVELMKAGERKSLGDPKTRRLQSYSSLNDVFQLYSTLLNSPDWEKFRFITLWPTLTREQQLQHYNEMACHELNFFLYHKDRAFFDQVVKPFIDQKLDPQLVDHWLLGSSLESFNQLWRIGRLNTLERILLAQQLAEAQGGTQRWLNEYLAANPQLPSERQQRFEVALRGTALGTGDEAAVSFDGAEMRDEFALSLGKSARGSEQGAMAGGGMGGYGMGMGGGYGGEAAPSDKSSAMNRAMPKDARQLRRNLALPPGSVPAFGGFAIDRQLSAGEDLGYFQSLDKTKEWAETQYYRIRLSEQSTELIRPNAFWQQFLKLGALPFMPSDLDLPCNNVNEAMCALAVIDLPFSASAPELSVDNEQLVIQSAGPSVVFLESIESSETGQADTSILVGQDIYLAQPDTAEPTNRPVQSQPLLRGIPYRASVVVTNPTSETKRVQVLHQLPAGSLPLAGSKVTRSSSLELGAYSTAQVQAMFYFPGEGEFSQYGAQINDETKHLAGTDSVSLRVLAEPESLDESTWSYVADWGSPEQVLQFLQQANLQQLDLSRIAFRMADKSFYEATLSLLATSGRFEPTLWAYAAMHNDAKSLEQLLQHHRDFVARLGSSLDSSVLHVVPSEQFSYEHLDYNPLVVARAHRLGPTQSILNPSMRRQYLQLLDVLAHQREIKDDAKLQVCYYLLLQNRIEEAIEWFSQVSLDKLDASLQYDYFDAYLDFYRGNYDRAAQIAAKYSEYPVPRWNNMFAQVRQQVAERADLLTGQTREATGSVVESEQKESEQKAAVDADQQLLSGEREVRQSKRGLKMPTLDLDTTQGNLQIRTSNLPSVRIHYYLMDIELLFSRKPFVSQGEGTLPVIQPNFSQEIELGNSLESSSRKLELPPELQNKNVLVEVYAEGISRVGVVTANALDVTVSEPFGRLQVMRKQGRGPVESAYVKVYARHADGSIRFYKDGYTDLRGQFDYATLSTPDLDSTQRFAILVLDRELGAFVREAAIPTR